ncbi:RelA/SpoT family protein [Denitratisoma oestradiolicum]|uniref:GTP pyrophosphokinase n=1 Tax=Denitratisoma oestradiolicum TaxID=311182 RepID=A0A6S6XVA4_9PROT|nr:bifunctional (p)ppGpp synthetase/guanosine-3',5'-bis(diphosphate) 3'-pyrophosphohydrolase [Denitratisoma oestradiolicum]TWO81919.1 GTP pyrophosphokinase [Denitratisoma oestradiolicum]CAB1368810.1 GTP pyrophosphokinase [Denitratisoma oestradiolicum]
MVAVVHSFSDQHSDDEIFALASTGLREAESARLRQAFDFARETYGERLLGTGEAAFSHAVSMAVILASLDLDLDTRLAALLFDMPDDLPDYEESLSPRFGAESIRLVKGLHRLAPLRLLIRSKSGSEVQAQTEILRKMLLAMVEDIRVVLLRLASRTQTLRWLTDHETEDRADIARESLDIYAPLANRLGVWQFKWELEDLSFRFTEPATYKRIAKMLEERRVERENFIESAVDRLKAELTTLGIEAEVYGRPKHIYSIWNKMRAKNLDFSQVYDVRALRIIVAEVRDCYTALGLVHQLWQPIHGEFDDYISHPKGNNYRSLHTAVEAEDGRAVEVQIRTREMHQHAELGVAAHWRYKESGTSARADSDYDDKISLLRQLLTWRDEVTDSSQWLEQFKRAALDDTLYVLTPQGRVIDLPRGATPLDFAYRLHTDLGHRCRGARVDGQLLPLNTPLKNGQRVEIVAAKSGGPSRDWLNPNQAYLATPGARRKVKQWFASQDEAELLAQGRSFVTRELQREGQSQANLEELAHKLGFRDMEAMFLAAAHNELGPRAIQTALRGDVADVAPEPEIVTRRSRATDSKVLIVGVDKLLTQLGRCCKPVPPDAIQGFVTRGKGVSIHRVDCINFRNMVVRNPERVISAEWGVAQEGALYAVDLLVEASDRQGLLRDISDVLSKEKVNVTAVKTLSKSGTARMAFTVELTGAGRLPRLFTLLGEVPGVVSVRRG